MEIDELIRIAVIGTHQADRVGQEGPLLLSAWTNGLQARAGWTPPHDPDPLPDPAPIESVRYFPLEILTILTQAETFSLVWRLRLDELRARLQQIGAMIPPEYVHAVLKAATWQFEHVIVSFLEGRGRWLKMWINQQELPSVETLDHLIHTDEPRCREVFQRFAVIDPRAAYTWFSTHGRELDTKLFYLLIVRHQLSLVDEPLLVDLQAEDTPEGLQVIARSLLGLLPGSRYHHRIQVCTEALFDYQDGQLMIRELDTATLTLLTNGLTLSQPYRYPPFETSSLSIAYQVVCLLPPSEWGKRWGISDKEVVDLAAGPGVACDMLTGIARACIYHHDTEMARTLLAHYPSALLRLWGSLIKRWTETEREHYLMTHEALINTEQNTISLFASQFKATWPWSRTFSVFALQKLVRLWPKMKVYHTDLGLCFSHCLYPDDLPEWQALLEATPHYNYDHLRLTRQRIAHHHLLRTWEQESG